MEKIIFFVLAVIFSIQIIREKGIKKLAWFFVGILFFPDSVLLLETPHMPFSRLVIFVLLTVTFFEKGWFSSFKKFPLILPLVILFSLLLCIGIFDDRLNYFLRFYRPVTYFVENFLILFLVFYYVKDVKDAQYCYRVLFWSFIFMSIYGILNFFTKHNEYNASISEAFGVHDVANSYMLTGVARFRVSSFTSQAIYYGFIVTIIIMFEVFMFNELSVLKKSLAYIISVPLLLVNLYLTNSRTPILTLLAGGGIYVLFAFKIPKKILTIICCVIVGACGLLLLPKNSNLVAHTLAIFTGQRSHEKEDGSSIEMRQKQLEASEKIFKLSPVLGNGYDYITEGLGYSADKSKNTSGKDFLGFESYYFKLLIEQGLCGIVGNVIFFAALFVWLFKSYFKVTPLGQKLVVFSIAITVMFLIFILGTGDLGSFPVFFSILAVNLKLITIYDKKRIVSIYVI